MKIEDKEELLKKKILNNYADFEDFKENYKDFHKLSDEAINFVERTFTPITPKKLIKALFGWVIVVLLFCYREEFFFWSLFVISWIASWGLFHKPIASLTIAEAVIYIILFLTLIGLIRPIFKLLVLLGKNLIGWCFCKELKEEDDWEDDEEIL